MRNGWLPGVVGVTAFVLFVVFMAPAAKLLPLVQPRLQGVSLVGVSGTLWSGSAQQLRVAGVSLDDVHWRWRPLALFAGSLEVAVNAQLNREPLRARAGTGLFSGAYVADARGRIGAADVLFLTGMRLVELGGRLEFELARVTGFDRPFPAVAGTLSWTPARVLAPLSLDLGSARLQTHIEDGGTRGELTASGGQLTASGDVALDPDGSYRLAGEVQKRGALPPAVDRFLATFGEFSNGSYRLEWADRIRF